VPFRVLRAVVQRGKGGVYQAIDLRGELPRLCLLKEGRRSGETSWDGRDGAWRVRHEERVLLQLAAAGVSVPKIYSAFELQGNYYLAMEFIAGETLLQALQKLQRRMPIPRALHLGIQLANVCAQLHRAGWAWRDCKPKNVIVTPEGRLVPIDFEGAAPLDCPDRLPWGTEGFKPPEYLDIVDGAAADLYALGAMLYLLLTGAIYDFSQPVSISKLRRNVPPELRHLVELLLDGSPAKRPSARASAALMTSILLEGSRRNLKAVKAA
jgi:serine/threonine protein kinase